MLMFPGAALTEIIEQTNNNMSRFNEDSASIKKGEFLKFLGIRIAMAIDPIRGHRNNYWNNTADLSSIILPRSYGSRFGMSKNRFNDINHYLTITNSQFEEQLMYNEQVIFLNY